MKDGTRVTDRFPRLTYLSRSTTMNPFPYSKSVVAMLLCVGSLLFMVCIKH